MRRPACILAIILAAIFLGSNVQYVQATTLDYFQVQHRNFENGTERNRVQFGGNPLSGSPFDLSKLIISSPGPLTLDNGKPLQFSATTYNFLSGTYDGNYSAKFGSWQPQINYSANVNAIPAGNYGIWLNGQYRSVDYPGPANLPVVKSSSFDLGDAFLPNGDFYFNWDDPASGRLPAGQTYALVIDGYIGQTFINEITVPNIPSDVHGLIYPRSIIDSLGSIDFMRLTIQVRDGFNRSYSNSIDVKIPVPESKTFLLLGAGLIGLAGYGRKKFNKLQK